MVRGAQGILFARLDFALVFAGCCGVWFANSEPRCCIRIRESFDSERMEVQHIFRAQRTTSLSLYPPPSLLGALGQIQRGWLPSMIHPPTYLHHPSVPFLCCQSSCESIEIGVRGRLLGARATCLHEYETGRSFAPSVRPSSWTLDGHGRPLPKEWNRLRRRLILLRSVLSGDGKEEDLAQWRRRRCISWHFEVSKQRRQSDRSM